MGVRPTMDHIQLDQASRSNDAAAAAAADVILAVEAELPAAEVLVPVTFAAAEPFDDDAYHSDAVAAVHYYYDAGDVDANVDDVQERPSVVAAAAAAAAAFDRQQLRQRKY